MCVNNACRHVKTGGVRTLTHEYIHCIESALQLVEAFNHLKSGKGGRGTQAVEPAGRYGPVRKKICPVSGSDGGCPDITHPLVYREANHRDKVVGTGAVARDDFAFQFVTGFSDDITCFDDTIFIVAGIFMTDRRIRLVFMLAMIHHKAKQPVMMMVMRHKSERQQ
jgi:hypothetical protein